MSSAEYAQPGLVRALGLLAATSIVICSIVGQGMFLKARVMTCNVGTPDLVFAAWIASGLLAACGALTYAELGALIPESGGPYAFLRAGYGPLAAFCFGWIFFFVVAPAGTAALGAGSAIFFDSLSGGALDRVHLAFSAFGAHIDLSGVRLFAAFMIAAVTAVNCLPVRTNGWLATVLTITKVLMVVGLALAAFVLGHGSWAHFASSGASGSCAGVASAARGGAGGFSAAMIGALYAYGGWQALTFLAAEVKDPGRTIPLAIIFGMVAVVILYVVANAAYFFVLSPQTIADIPPTSSVGVELVRSIFGSSSAGIAAAIVFVSVTATLHVTVCYYARVTYAFARDGLFFPALGTESPWSRIPVRAVVTTGALASALALVGSFDVLSDYTVINEWLFFALAGTTIFVFRRRISDSARPYKVWGYPIVPAIFIGVATVLLIETAVTTPVKSLVGIALVIAGLPVYWYQSSRARRRLRAGG